MDQLWSKMRNPLGLFSLSILLISRLPNVINKTYHGTGENQFSAEHIGELVSITLCQLVEQLRPKMGNPLATVFFYFINIMSS